MAMDGPGSESGVIAKINMEGSGLKPITSPRSGSRRSATGGPAVVAGQWRAAGRAARADDDNNSGSDNLSQHSGMSGMSGISGVSATSGAQPW